MYFVQINCIYILLTYNFICASVVNKQIVTYITCVCADIKFQCMGSWTDDQDNVWAAVADLGQVVYRERFRCMVSILSSLSNTESFFLILSLSSHCLVVYRHRLLICNLIGTV